MEKRTIKLDASGLIYLTKAGLLDLVESLYEEIIITEAVYQEAVVQGKAGGYPDALVIEQAVAAGRMQVKQLSSAADEKVTEMGFPERLGAGEQETIVEALEQKCLAVLDDLLARAMAAVLDVTLCRTDTVLVEGLLKRQIELTEFEDMAVRLAGVMDMRADDLAELLRLGRLIEEVRANGEQDVERES